MERHHGPADRLEATKMKSIPLESTIKNAIRKRLLEMGCWLRKTSPGPYGYQPGTLDFVGIYKGRGFCLEVKRPGPKHVITNPPIVNELPMDCWHCWKECTPTQRIEIEAVRRAGGIAHVVTNAQEAQFVVEASESTSHRRTERIL